MVATDDMLRGVESALSRQAHLARLPSRGPRERVLPLNFAVFTRDGLGPRADNLALLLAMEPDGAHDTLWRRRMCELEASALIIPRADQVTLLFDEGSSPAITVSLPDALSMLTSRQIDIFSPRALLRRRLGQLPLSAREHEVARGSFAFALRNQGRVARSIEDAVKECFEIETQARCGQPSQVDTERDVVSVALALVAARTLDDKGFLNDATTLPLDPRAMLDRAIEKVNGILKKTRDEVLDRLSVPAKQVLALHLGLDTSFALMDYEHLGQVYERLVDLLPKDEQHQKQEERLQRHYTPVALANRMLDHLPVEQIRPEHRQIFDPAAGSGSLLLAATRRLAGLTDLPIEAGERARYLTQRVAGNDLDENARRITGLKYYLAWGQYALVDTRPDLMQRDLFSLDAAMIARHCGRRPTIYVANPPYNDDRVQMSARFVQHALSWTRAGDLLGFVLPQTVLHSDIQGNKEARRLLFDHSHMLEIWELPEGAVGLKADQATAVILARRDDSAPRHVFQYRQVVSRKDARNRVRGKAFLGTAHLDVSHGDTSLPAVRIVAPTVPLGALYHVYIGVTLDPQVPPVHEPESGVRCARLWKPSWRRGRIWADPIWHDPDPRLPTARWIRLFKDGDPECSTEAQRKYLKRPEWRNQPLFKLPKLIVNRSANQDGVDPIGACLDDHGLVPNSDCYCICTQTVAGADGTSGGTGADVPEGWTELSNDDRLFWLLALLKSKPLAQLHAHRRSARRASANSYRNLPLPSRVDHRLIELIRQAVESDRWGRLPAISDAMQHELDARVASAYGNPETLEVGRDAEPAAYDAWCREREKAARPVVGQILAADPSQGHGRIRMYLNGLLDDDEEFDLPLPPELPGWTLDGHVFTAWLSDDVTTAAQLAKRPWALRDFRGSARPYLTADELDSDTSALP